MLRKCITSSFSGFQTSVTIEIRYQPMDGTAALCSHGENLDVPDDRDGMFTFETDSLLSGHSRGSGASAKQSLQGSIPTFRKWVCHDGDEASASSHLYELFVVVNPSRARTAMTVGSIWQDDKYKMSPKPQRLLEHRRRKDAGCFISKVPSWPRSSNPAIQKKKKRGRVSHFFHFSKIFCSPLEMHSATHACLIESSATRTLN